MQDAKPRLAVLTDYFLHPTEDGFLPTNENIALLELALFIRDGLGWETDIFQVSPIPVRRFKSFKVIGLNDPAGPAGLYSRLNFHFAQAGMGYDLRLYYHWHLAFPQVLHRSIVVSQGIFWDTPSGVINQQNEAGREEWWKGLLYAVSAPAAFVAQDRNTVNYIKAAWPGYDHRVVYLPPGVDLDRFRPPEARPPADTVRVICPQDFGAEGGLNELLALCRLIREADLNVHFEILGRTREFATALDLARSVRALPNCRFRWVPLSHLPAAYQGTDLAVLPYRASVGASFHCLRAMACGLPVVACLTGGLGELVVDGWNGLMVRPGSAVDQREKVSALAGDGNERLRMGKNARHLAEGYPVAVWRQRWRDLLVRVLEAPLL